MLAIKRKSVIKDLVLENKSVIVVDLAKKFGVTEETIRRDLKSLEAEGVLTRTYGGAFVQSGVINDVSLAIRETFFIENKQLIADKCTTFVHNGDFIFLDCSTTAYYVAKAIKDMRLTVMTNSLKITNLLASYQNIRLITVGGILDHDSMSFTGKSVTDVISTYFFDVSFISCRSLSLEHGITDSEEQKAMTRKLVVQHSNKTYLIADYSKFDKTSFVKTCDFSDIDAVVVDKKLSKEWHSCLSKANVALYECE